MKKTKCILCGEEYDVEYMRRLLSTHTAREVTEILPYVNDPSYVRNLAKRLGVDLLKTNRVIRTIADPSILGKRSDSLCWDCANATNGALCPWVESYTPVDGWSAIPRKIKFNTVITDSYTVKACPLFKKG